MLSEAKHPYLGVADSSGCALRMTTTRCLGGVGAGQEVDRGGANLVRLAMADPGKDGVLGVHPGLLQQARETLCSLHAIVADVAVPLVWNVRRIGVAAAYGDPEGHACEPAGVEGVAEQISAVGDTVRERHRHVALGRRQRGER